MLGPFDGISSSEKQLQWLRTGLQLVLDLGSDVSDLEILEAVAQARSAELGNKPTQKAKA